MNEKEYKPRLSIEIRPDQAEDLGLLIPHGMQKPIFVIIVDDVIRMIRKHKEMFFAAVLAKDLKLMDYTSLEIKDKDGNNL